MDSIELISLQAAAAAATSTEKTANENIESLDEIFTCKICKEYFIDPITTSCNQVVCKEHVEEKLAENGERIYSCLICNESHVINQDEFSLNTLTIKMLRLNNKHLMKKRETKSVEIQIQTDNKPTSLLTESSNSAMIKAINLTFVLIQTIGLILALMSFGYLVTLVTNDEFDSNIITTPSHCDLQFVRALYQVHRISPIYQSHSPIVQRYLAGYYKWCTT